MIGMLKRGDKDYKPSYIMLKGEYHYFDKAKVVRDAGKCKDIITYEAYGDGAHLVQTDYYSVYYANGAESNHYTGTFAYHNQQVEELFNKSLKVVLTLDGKEEVFPKLS